MFELKPTRITRSSNDGLNLWNPFSEMEELEKNFFGSDFFRAHDLAEFKTDITDEGDHYQLKADLPGFNKEDIHLDIEGSELRVSAERHSEHEEKDKRGKFVRCERTYGAYSRSFDVSGVDTEGITAAYEGGVLSLKLPKKTQQTPQTRRLTIE